MVRGCCLRRFLACPPLAPTSSSLLSSSSLRVFSAMTRRSSRSSAGGSDRSTGVCSSAAVVPASASSSSSSCASCSAPPPSPSVPPCSVARSAVSSSPWHSLLVPARELRCAVTLTNGQCFSWRKHPTRPEWTGVLGQCVLSLRQEEDDTLFRVHHPLSYCESAVRAVLRDFLLLDRARLVELYADWSADDRFASVGARLPGMRLLRQEPLECLVSFICSSCNNIARITQMTGALRRKYGRWLCDTTVAREDGGQHGQGEGQQRDEPSEDGEQAAAVESFYSFPSLAQLASIPSSELRSLGFGYRAEYVTETAREVQRRGGVEWLIQWRSPAVSTDEVVEALQELPGVGPKVAACVALFSLDRLDLIPVDTHVHQIALRDYGNQLSSEVRRSRSVNKKVHSSIAALFRDKFGPLAGWAHSVLFTAELPAFRHLMDTAGRAGENSNTSTEAAASAAASTATQLASLKKAERKRQRGGKLGAEHELAEKGSSGRAADQRDHHSSVSLEVTVRIEDTLQFPVVKRARIPRKATVIIKRTQQRTVIATNK